ncbi:aminomethyltransferase [Cyclobacterium lianum]|uniref:Aminomethyltransferase n=1 Tax=Cyclobacterium lianum TaxID=388280 RepID=A0A1M7Q9T5_9BACT|nr:glycine cleavage system aminomethyltransferase GcvT [Cyclobacterium lianum]SHN27387.1 aminomethyltransferase [Cyclobacterium lianum]
MQDQIKKITLNDVHESLGAKMAPFAGYYMPVRYSSDMIEHLTVREKVGVFDVSHMGEFLVKGKHALDLIQRISTNDAARLSTGQAQYSCMPNETGGIVDDLLVYKMDEASYMLVVNAANIAKDWEWIKRQNTLGAEMENISDDISLFAVQGPLALKALAPLTDVDLREIPFYHFKTGTLAGVQDVIISATGYTGAGGFELYVKNKDAHKVWDDIFDAGKNLGIQPIGLGARDTLRLEMGYCLYGNDITDETSPIEAGLGWITKFNKEFVNHKALKAQKENGVSRKLVGFILQEKGIPRAGYPIADKDGHIIGKVTSGSISPSMGVGIGLGYVGIAHTKPGTAIGISIRKKIIPATVAKLPLLKK